MKFLFISEILKYFDCFGARFNFYIEKNRKLYTPLGGILTLLSCIFGILIFVYINLDDFLHNLPDSTTSTETKNHRIIKFKEEKIWIPWRIRDFGGKTINHTNLFYPIIYYYKGIRDNELKSMITSYEFINYKLCNETSMVNNTYLYMIDIELDQLYCIDMEELNMGGSWDSDFLFLVTFDLYACKDGIDYDENNKNCTSYEKIDEIAGNNNCFEFEMYYPIVHYQPINKTIPIFIEYTNYFYHLSRYSNKIDRLYLQQHILKDDKGWISKEEKIYSRWGCASLNGDSYSTGEERDLMNEGSTSRFYSFNIYLKSDIVFYNRSYKKIYLIIAEGLPIINIVFIIFRIIAKIFKISSVNKKLTELLFENLKEKKTLLKVRHNNLSDNKRLSLLKNNSKTNHKNITINNIINDFSSIQLTHQHSGKKNLFENNNSIAKSNNEMSKNNKDRNSQIINKIHSKREVNQLFNGNITLEENKNMNNSININHHIDEYNNKNNDISSNLPFNNINIVNDLNSHDNKNSNNLTLLNINYIKKKLFPYKYYLCTIFIKNIDISKKSFFFTNKFIAVYNFICQLFDISSYLILQREFQTMKNTIVEEKYRNIIEKAQKINVSARSFHINMKECLNDKKLSIFGKIK